MQILNLKLMSHPFNWVTIWLMLFIAGIALHLVLTGIGVKPPSSQAPGYGSAPAQAQNSSQPPA